MCDEIQKAKNLRIAAWKFQEDLAQFLKCPYLKESKNQSSESLIILVDAYREFKRAIEAAA